MGNVEMPPRGKYHTNAPSQIVGEFVHELSTR